MSELAQKPDNRIDDIDLAQEMGRRMKPHMDQAVANTKLAEIGIKHLQDDENYDPDHPYVKSAINAINVVTAHERFGHELDAQEVVQSLEDRYLAQKHAGQEPKDEQ